MKSFLLAALLLALGLPTAYAGALDLNPQYKPEHWDGRAPVIDPDSSVYGLKFGSTEADILAAFGDPRGVIIINDSKKALLYGRSHMFIFRRGKLSELMVSKHIFYWELSREVDEHPIFDRRWSLKPGIKREMNFGEVMKNLGKTNAVPNYKYTYDTENATITLNFSGWKDRTGPEAYQLMGFRVLNLRN